MVRPATRGALSPTLSMFPLNQRVSPTVEAMPLRTGERASRVVAMPLRTSLQRLTSQWVVDPRALREALAGGQIHSAAVDVFPEEPPGEDWDDILDHPRMIATGHYAWYSVGAARDLQRLAAGNMRAMLMGETPADCLNPGC